VAINIPVPAFGLELGRHRLVPAYLHRTALTGEMFSPTEAMTAGFLDRLVDTKDLQLAAMSVAAALTKIDLSSHRIVKMRLRKAAIGAVRAAIDEEITLEAYQRSAAARPTTA
jgi:enoyl-CoA hydratase